MGINLAELGFNHKKNFCTLDRSGVALKIHKDKLKSPIRIWGFERDLSSF